MSDILRNFDKKNEIPKIKIPKFATGGICNDAIFPKIDAFSQIDEIVKDIRDRQDNAMAMEFTKCIEELLRKNGVVPKMTEYTRNFETDNTFETRYGVSIDELDFSEHDKVFENKIAKLEKENKSLNSYLVQREQDSTDMIMKLKQEKSDKNEKIAELSCENESLKQRIVELESKKTEKPTKINLNDRIKVKLTPLGAEIYYHQYDDIHKDYPKMKKHLQSSLPKVDENGYTEFQLWHFVELYGEHIGMRKKNVIDPLDIIIVE